MLVSSTLASADMLISEENFPLDFIDGRLERMSIIVLEFETPVDLLATWMGRLLDFLSLILLETPELRQSILHERRDCVLPVGFFHQHAFQILQPVAEGYSLHVFV